MDGCCGGGSAVWMDVAVVEVRWVDVCELYAMAVSWLRVDENCCGCKS